ncbi:hypothetical protein C1I98_31510 [Spongiactinospora gelatinilytica]|uniref:Uncharacterized protein n=1 Tax=Spongiactinospora gelatinilytica TaxID=2666298 RepID=A0A2W2FNF4_9ACTN|nr:hypothetical protein C1I98_31510 [Spongiactinospora gelatinilytica]
MVWLDPRAVRRVVHDEPAPVIAGWEDLPYEPPVDLAGRWSPIWEAAAGVALARSPQVREPWLRAIYDRVRDRTRWRPVDG